MTAFWVTLAIIAALVAVAAWAAVRISAWFDQALDDALRLDAERAYRETREKMDDAEIADDPAAARRWLHERAAATEQRRDL